MSIKETGATHPQLPGTPDIDYEWTDIALRRNPDTLDLPLAEQDIRLSVRCVGTADGATARVKDVDVSITLDTEALLALSAANKTKVKAFVAVCEKGAAKAGQTHTDDFSL